MDDYQDCEVCGRMTPDEFFCDEHAAVIGVVEEAMADPVVRRARWIAVAVTRYLRTENVPKRIRGRHEAV